LKTIPLHLKLNKKTTMKLLRNLSIWIVALSFWQNTQAQEQLGWMNDNYAGVNGIDLQPASIVDSRFKFDMSILHFNASFTNNYVGIRRNFISDKGWDTDGDFKNLFLTDRYPLPRYDDPQDSLKNIYDGKKPEDVNIYMNIQSSLPILNFMVTINSKNSFALTTKSRTMFNLDNMSPELARLAYSELGDRSLWQTRLSNENLNINAMSWGEVGVTYGREIFSINDHYLKGAVRAKYLLGLAAAYLYSDKIEYEFKNDDTLSIYNSDVSYGLASNVDDDLYEDFSFSIPGKPTFGWDFGFVYEWRKGAAEKYQYDMDGQTGLWRRDQNKYKLKVGFSVVDLGRVRFDKATGTGNFNANINEWDISNFDPDGINGFNDTINTRFLNTTDEGDFKMQLPTAISYQIDYRIWKPFYINHTGFLGVQRNSSDSRTTSISTYSIAPRIETKWFGLSIPYSYQPNFQQHRVGAMLRLGPLVIGTDNLLNYFGSDVVYGADVYVALKMPIMFKKPKDKDGDKVSNRKDNCDKEPGVWENRGCPGEVKQEPTSKGDLDGDGVLDISDKCIDVPGPAENNGCPFADKDGDGVLDNADQCIDVPGPKENNGCPYTDKDGDGVLDNADQCIDVPGPKENNGCPFNDRDGDGVIDNSDQCMDVAGPKENNGCPYSDRDNDGLIDKDDKCPDAPGPASNNGCPELDTDGDGILDKNDDCPKTPGVLENRGCPKIEEKEKEILDKAFNNLEFETGRAVIKLSSYDELDALVGLLKSKPESKLKISGHTDSVGSDALNLQLSKVRSEAVRNYLVKKGVPLNRFIVEFFGETQPIADNATPEGRSQNRRVEMMLMFE
jgi:outer membrane protein OmpA-like peptidoglycan-associated protein